MCFHNDFVSLDGTVEQSVLVSFIALTTCVRVPVCEACGLMVKLFPSGGKDCAFKSRHVCPLNSFFVVMRAIFYLCGLFVVHVLCFFVIGPL